MFHLIIFIYTTLKKDVKGIMPMKTASFMIPSRRYLCKAVEKVSGIKNSDETGLETKSCLKNTNSLGNTGRILHPFVRFL